MKYLSGKSLIILVEFIAVFGAQISSTAYAQKIKTLMKVDTAVFETVGPISIHYSVRVPKGWTTDKLDDELRFLPPDTSGLSFEYPPHIRFQKIKDGPKLKNGFSKNPNGVSMYWDQKEAMVKFQVGKRWYGISIVECNYPELGLDPEKLKKEISTTLMIGPAMGKSEKVKY